jgi:hypothetical protein
VASSKDSQLLSTPSGEVLYHSHAAVKQNIEAISCISLVDDELFVAVMLRLC